MSCTGKRIDGITDRRASARQPVALLGSAITLDAAKSIIVEDVCPTGAKIVGRLLPTTGKEMLLRTTQSIVLGRIAWAEKDFRGVVFEEGTLAWVDASAAVK